MTRKLLAVLIVTLLVTAAFAQESAVKGNLSGTVYDSTGAVVPGAKVTLSGPLGTKSIDTDNEGHFMFPLLVPGFYSVKVEKQGFKASEVKGVEIATNKTSAIRISVEPGAVSEVVEVSAPAVTVDTSSTAVGANLTDSFYSQVPVARNVTGLFYVAPGAVGSGGAGAANPSISGGSGLENQYVADGVSITDGAFGGIGVFSRLYGSLSTGINLSFVQEVQVKSGGYEPQYGKSTGGIVQIVTKSGGSAYHGSVGAFFAPQGLEADRLQPDLGGDNNAAPRFNQLGQVTHQAAFDVSGEIGGYVPGFRDKLFFFGSFNPSWNRDYGTFSPMHDVPVFFGGPTQTLSTTEAKSTVYNYAAKLTWKMSANHTLEGSVFGDPTRTPFQAGAPGVLGLGVISETTFDRLSFGTRNVVVRWNGTWSPTWLMNASLSWGHNYLGDTPLNPDLTGITNNIGCIAPVPTTAQNGGVETRTPEQIQNGCAQAGNAYLGAHPAADYPNPLGAPVVLTTSPFYSLGAVNPNPVGCPVSAACNSTGGYIMQGLGYFENTEGDNYGFAIDTQKSFHFLGNHSLSVGYKLDRNFYDGHKTRSGGLHPLPMADALGAVTDPTDIYGDAAGVALAQASAGFNASGQLRATNNRNYPLYPLADGSLLHTRFYQTRGEFGAEDFFTAGTYHAIYGMDSWSPWKYITINAGLRWEQQYIQGTFNPDAPAGQQVAHYTWVGNWSPRIGVIVDPWGDRKTKVSVNFGRYNYAIPLDMAIRSLSNEYDSLAWGWTPAWVGQPAGGGPCPSPCAALMQFNPDGTIPEIQFTENNLIQPFGAIGLSGTTAIAPGTKMESLDEWVVGFERDFGHGVIFSARYIDRRMKRIVEDMAGLSPEAYNAGLAQQYFISNPNSKTDLFVNPIQFTFTPGGAVPAACLEDATDPNSAPYVLDPVTDTFGSTLGAMCVVPTTTDPDGAGPLGPIDNYIGGHNPGDPVSDGIPEGFVNPARNYQAIELEVNKSFSKNWQLRSNYRIARLKGNYEGAFRNDNGQTDPSISSLFDFTAGSFELLGNQFAIGYLNTDRRHVVNTYFSYVFDKTMLKGLTIGTGVRVQTGTPINDFKAHPAYLNAGEIPVGGRGSLGRLPTTGQVDVHADYAFRVTEKSKIRVGMDLFNIANMKRQTNIDQNEDRSFGVPNADFQKVTGRYTGFQRPFYGRFMVKWEF